ncbi:MAG: hypothetical protein ACPHJ3_15880, partial [Rubripirellula sp.]
GPKKGEIEIDELTIWSAKVPAHPDWPTVRTQLPKFQPVQLKQPKDKTRPKANPPKNTGVLPQHGNRGK